jgi:hypothetical protein
MNILEHCQLDIEHLFAMTGLPKIELDGGRPFQKLTLFITASSGV